MPKDWDQAPFNAAIARMQKTVKEEKFPAVLNKKGFFIALRAMALTPKKEGFAISKELARIVTATRKDGTTGSVPIGWVIAAKRLGKRWPELKMARGIKRKSGKEKAGRAYLAALEKTFDRMLGSRKRAAGFLRIGWLSVVKSLGPYLKNRAGAPGVDTGGAKLMGAMKGSATPARASWTPTCTIINSAQARSDGRNGLIRFGTPPFQKAFDLEAADTIRFLDQELKDAVDKANNELK